MGVIIDSKIEIQAIYQHLDAEGYEFNEYNLFGVRNFKGIKEGIFNDSLCLLGDNELFICAGTTDPSPYYIREKPMNANGTAVLLEGLQPKIWMVGPHGKARVTGLINGWRFGFGTKKQRVKRLNKDFKFTGKIYKGWFACNFHPHFNRTTPDYIGRNSAGCQVPREKRDFEAIMSRITGSSEYKSNKRTLYSYYIFTQNSLAGKMIDLTI